MMEDFVLKQTAYTIVLADPAHNRTAFVLDNVAATQRPAVARALMARPEGIEQVGFVCPYEGPAWGRLEMMGGEFCGNAARSFGLYLAQQRGLAGPAEVPVEISGCPHVLNVRVDTTASTARAEMPLPIEVLSVRLQEQDCPVIRFDGITHVIIPDQVPQEDWMHQAQQALSKRFDCDALGLLFWDTQQRFLTPVVTVRKTGTTVRESSCGSGCVALAVYLSQTCQNGAGTYVIEQPGGRISAQVIRQEGHIVQASIGGAVEIQPARTVQLTLPLAD